MQLMFKRKQGQSFFGAIFNLHAKLELDEEEMKLVGRYGMSGSIVIHAIQPGLFRSSATIAFLCFLVSYPIITFNFYRSIGLGFMGVLVVSALIGIVCGYIWYHQKRETIYLKDLMVGRYFKCGSVVDLAKKEYWLVGVTSHLRQVLESAKHWGGNEIVEIPVLSKEGALRAIVKG